MKRSVIKIDENLCNGCGNCVSGCHEGALQMIDNKARLVSELFCDGLGACIGECPVGAIELEEREAEPYSEYAVMERIAQKGENTILAHLKHLKDHGEIVFLKQGLDYLKENNIKINTELLTTNKMNTNNHEECGCPGGKAIDMRKNTTNNESVGEIQSQLQQWPVQLHLLNPEASYFQNADLLFASDCSAFAMGGFHSKLMKGKSIAIACPKLDSNKESYVEKLAIMIDNSKINTITVVMMEVPCCGGLLQLTKMALEKASRKIPVKAVYVSLQGNILEEEWV